MKAYYFIAITLLSLAACSSNSTSNEEKNNKIPYEYLHYVTAQTLEEIDVLTLNGKVTYNQDEIVVFKPISDGIVVKSFFTAGDYVKAGQKLLNIKSDAFYELQTEIESAQGDFKLAQRELKKSEQMFEDKLLSEQEIIEAQVEYSKAKSTLERLEASLKMYGSAIGRGIYQVSAQSNGYVFSKNASPASTITPDDEVYTLGQIDNLWIMANIYAKSIEEVTVGQSVIIKSPSYPSKLFNGKIVKVLPYIDPEEKVMKARIEFENKDLALKPDFTVEVKVLNENLKNKIYLPSECLVFDNNKFYVLKKKSGALKIQEVTILKQDKNNTVIQEGVQLGDSILSKNPLLYYTQLK